MDYSIRVCHWPPMFFFLGIQVGQNFDKPYTGSNYDFGATVRFLFLSFQPVRFQHSS